MMYNPQLDTFICVVEAGSFSKAADKLYISPPAVIKQINSLENNLGVQLFARTHRGLVVTAAGESLYQDAKYMVNYSKEAIERAREAGNDEDDVIRVGISPMTPPDLPFRKWKNSVPISARKWLPMRKRVQRKKTLPSTIQRFQRSFVSVTV